MNYGELKLLVDMGYSTYGIARKLYASQTNVRHWLGKFQLKTDRSLRISRCRCKCGETDPNKYYGNKRTQCAKCDNAYTVHRQREMAKRVRSRLGGKCAYCGYAKFQIALAVHHVEPDKKDLTFHSMRGWSWLRVLKELEKCVLACHNCHSAVHAGLLPFNPNEPRKF